MHSFNDFTSGKNIGDAQKQGVDQQTLSKKRSLRGKRIEIANKQVQVCKRERILSPNKIRNI